MSFPSQLAEVKAAGEDLEWYPTTNEIISRLVTSISGDMCNIGFTHKREARLLDVGAGNGKVLKAVFDAVREVTSIHAIEKSQVLRSMMPAEVFLMGVDFWNVSLIDKKTDFVFSNPPYKQFVEWSAKILRESPGESVIYLVIPERWETCQAITDAAKARNFVGQIVGRYDFEDAEDRKARCKVHLVRFRVLRHRDATDPFQQFFDETFQYPEPPAAEPPLAERVAQTQVVERLNFVEALCHLYDLALADLAANYTAACRMDFEILQEFGLNKAHLVQSLRDKLDTLKKEYWQRLFDGMEEIKARLTKASRLKMAGIMQSQTGIEFNRENAYAVILWVLQHANSYFDAQLVQVYEAMVDFANVETYKSNERVFETKGFRYDYFHPENGVKDFRLKVGHRLVLLRSGGAHKRGNWGGRKGLDERGADFIGDLLTVARNLGFELIDTTPAECSWQEKEAHVIRFRLNGEDTSLARVRIFQNSNMHVQFHPSFIHAMNTQHGKLKGWLRSAKQAATELEIPEPEAEKLFRMSSHIEPGALRITAG